MEGSAECKICNEGTLLPFYGPEGHVVYFCNNCMSRFSAYNDEPFMDGAPVFSRKAHYITAEEEDDESFTTGELMDEFKRVLDEYPPKPIADDACIHCSRGSDSEGNCPDLCYLPEV